jgi:hypothetical protein
MDAPPDGNALCLACGACCDGTWHPYVNLEPGEDRTARTVGMVVIHVEGSPKGQLPCSSFKNGCCSTYGAWRPAACHGYHCRLLDDVTQGRMPLAEALGHVKAVHEMKDRIRKELPHLPGGLLGIPFYKRIAEQEEAAAGRPGVSASTRLDAVALNMYYAKYFRPAEAPPPARG